LTNSADKARGRPRSLAVDGIMRMACLETVVNHGILYVLRIVYPNMMTEIDGSRLGGKLELTVLIGGCCR
jgi:hypothetical protein